MARWFPCPYLGVDVELTDEREAHIRLKHEAALDKDFAFLAGALQAPQQVRRSLTDSDARLFVRWYDELEGGKFIIAVVVDSNADSRHWVITAYVTDQPRRGILEWPTT